MKKLTQLIAASALLLSGTAQASVADSFTIPGADAGKPIGATMPYTRYESPQAALGGGAVLATAKQTDYMNLAAQASDQSYIKLPGSGAYAEWTMKTTGRGVCMRFTMPDSSNGMGLEGSLDIYVNGNKVKTVNLTSYYMYQYFGFGSGTPSDTPNGSVPAFGFDETHFLLDRALAKGDKIRVQSSGAGGVEYGVDFLEIENVPDPIEPDGQYINVCDYGATPDDGRDDLNAFKNALKAANSGCKVLYIPEGTYHLGGMWDIYAEGVKIMGAGIWYTNIKFTSSNQGGGGVSGGNPHGGSYGDGLCKNVEFCHMYLNSNLRSRYNENAIYKCFMDVWADGSVIHDIWEDHFECGFWIADYNGSRIDYCDGLKIVNCRIRNNLADGVNFCNGTSNAAVYNCSIRNCGDDGLAIWNNDYQGSKDETGNVFAYNTIENVWRAGGIAIYGGIKLNIYNNYIRDMFMASGIHLNNTFPGHKYSNTQSILFENNILVACGTEKDCWNEDLAAVDVKMDIKNITFRNTQIYNSPHYAIRELSGPTNVTFDNTTILGSGLDGREARFSCPGHSACAIRVANENVKFINGLTIGNVAKNRAVDGNTNSTWPLWTDNNASLARSINYTYVEDATYTVPNPPTPNEVQEGGITDVVKDLYGYNIAVKGLAWGKTAGSGDINEEDNVTFSVLLHNDGTTDIPAGVGIEVQFTVDGSTKLTATTKEGLEANGTMVLTSGAWKASAGAHEVTAVADYRDKFYTEDNEGDNMATKKFNVYATETPAYTFTPVNGGFDFKVLDILYQRCDANGNLIDATPGKGEVNAGDRIVFSAVVVNAGNADAPRGSKLGVQFQVDGVNYGTGLITWADKHYDGLASHQMITLTANGGGGSSQANGPKYWTVTRGDHDIMAWVNDTPSSGYGNEMDSSEADNQLTVSYTFPKSPIQYHEYPDTPDRMTLDVSGVEGITEEVAPADTNWYTVSGVRLNGEPTQPGLYIHAGRKIMIR